MDQPLKSKATSLGRALRHDFPFFSENPKTVFLDSAASSLTPKSVIDSVLDYYKKYSVNIHRGVYKASVNATNQYESVREQTKAFLNCSSKQEIIFTSGTTASLNLLAYSLSATKETLNQFFSGWDGGLKPKDVILISESEHHSNIVPWQIISKKMDLRLEFIPVQKNGLLDTDWFREFVKSKPPIKIISLAHVSNASGVIHNLDPFAEVAKALKIPFIVDGAQSVCHTKQDLANFPADFLAFSAHKMLGPTGLGVLVGNKDVLGCMEPFLGGGDMILTVTKKETTYNHPPHRFEAGTPQIAQVFGFGAAIDYINSIGMANIEAWEKELTLYAMASMEKAGIRLYGPSLKEVENGVQKAGVISFDMPGIHPHDIGTILDESNVATRNGHHCCQILMKSWNVPATSRASFYLYNDFEDIDQLVEGMKIVQKIFRLDSC